MRVLLLPKGAEFAASWSRRRSRRWWAPSPIEVRRSRLPGSDLQPPARLPEALVEALARANRRRNCPSSQRFARRELKRCSRGVLARAGFDKLELGLQSVNATTLRRVGRGGSPAMLAAAAKLLRAEGVELLIDLIVGLPTDTADDVARSVDFLRAHGLGTAQVSRCSCSLAPRCVEPRPRTGSSLRETSLSDHPHPHHGRAGHQEALQSAKERLGREGSMEGRARTSSPSRGCSVLDVFRLDLERCRALNARPPPGLERSTVRSGSRADLLAHRAELLRAVEARQAVDPTRPWTWCWHLESHSPSDLLAMVRSALDASRQATRRARCATAAMVMHSGFGWCWMALQRCRWSGPARSCWRLRSFSISHCSRPSADGERLGVDASRAPGLWAWPMAQPLGCRGAGRPRFRSIRRPLLETLWQRRTLGHGDVSSRARAGRGSLPGRR